MWLFSPDQRIFLLPGMAEVAQSIHTSRGPQTHPTIMTIQIKIIAALSTRTLSEAQVLAAEK